MLKQSLAEAIALFAKRLLYILGRTPRVETNTSILQPMCRKVLVCFIEINAYAPWRAGITAACGNADTDGSLSPVCKTENSVGLLSGGTNV